MGFPFVKMHGLGNDYVYVDLITNPFDADWAALAQEVSPRNFGVGSDGLILIAGGEKTSVMMRIFNADGSEAQMCGNGLRCTAKYAYEHGLLDADLTDLPEQLAAVTATSSVVGGKWQAAPIETLAGVLTVAVHATDDNIADVICVDMGAPILEGKKIPTTLHGDMIVNEPLDLPSGRMSMTCVSMGNPHAVVYVDDLSAVDLEAIGPSIENHETFPERTNVHFAHAADEDTVEMITWERGSGRTLACGTGACAVVVAGILEGRLNRTVATHLPGGKLDICWSQSDDHVYMMGPATEVFSGIWP